VIDQVADVGRALLAVVAVCVLIAGRERGPLRGDSTRAGTLLPARHQRE
jgi:hypothetical protein